MDFVSYSIEGGDYTRAGAASRAIKEHLKRIGADADAVRRTMIAAYEAEMNVVIHARRGRLEAGVSERAVEVNVIDEGPGIPDVEQAMQEGFSTATSDARALGFGAGMGLPNIKRNSDRLRLTSRVDEGTRVSFTVLLKPAVTQETPLVSLYASAELCRDCRRCVTACPTGAMRVRDGRPSVLEHLCIDCAACIAACSPHALTLNDNLGSLAEVERRGETVLAVPPGLLTDFGEHAGVARVLAELKRLGFAGVLNVAAYDDALRREVLNLARSDERAHPLISPVCPAVVQLVELRFPSLLGHLAPFDSPWEALQADTPGRLACVVCCPSQRSALLAVETLGGADVVEAVSPALARSVVQPALATGARGPASPSARLGGDVEHDPGDELLSVTGVRHVLAVLEEIENGLLNSVSVVEPLACDGGCIGSPLFTADAYVAAHRWRRAVGAGETAVPLRGARAVPRRRPFAARPGIRLDADMGRAIQKLAQLEAEVRSLPGKDCVACGAPTCAALAEDVVMGRVPRSLCPYVQGPEVPAT